MNDRKAHAFVLLCARYESIGIQKVECFAELTFCVPFEFLSTDSKRSEESLHGNSCTSLRNVGIVPVGSKKEHTCLATLPDLLVSFPVLPNSSTVPIGASFAVAVVRVTLSDNAHKEDKASPRNPNVSTEERSSNEDILDVQCFNADQSIHYYRRHLYCESSHSPTLS